MSCLLYTQSISIKECASSINGNLSRRKRQNKIIKPAVLVKYFKITHFYVVNFTCLVLIFQVRHTQSTFNTLEIDLIPFSDRYTTLTMSKRTFHICLMYKILT